MKYLFLCFSILLASCASTQDSNLPEFSTDRSVIAEAKNKFRKSEAKILFLLMVDEGGKVVKVRIISNKLQDKQATNMFKQHMFTAEYPKAKEGEPKYREFFFPFGVKESVVFYG